MCGGLAIRCRFTDGKWDTEQAPYRASTARPYEKQTLGCRVPADVRRTRRPGAIAPKGIMTTSFDYGISPAGYRLPDATHVGGVRLQVADLQRSIDYYTQVIGLRVLHRDPSTAALAAQGGDRPLVRLHARPGTLPVPRRGAFGLYHFAILLPDRAALGRFIVHLARLGVRAGSADHLVSEALYLTDPDGLGIEVYCDRPRASWRHVNRELAMATDPLDTAAVAAAGRGEAWTGAPAGTTIGHLHLHVGDLDQARRFFHDALGFAVTVWGYPGALFFGAGGYHHHLGTNTWAPGPAATDAHARLLDWELLLPSAADTAAAALSLTAAGYAPQQQDGACTVADPWGTRLVLQTG
jgi:catechol 2,3-dioxygenase